MYYCSGHRVLFDPFYLDEFLKTNTLGRMTNVGEDVDKWGHRYASDGTVNCPTILYAQRAIKPLSLEPGRVLLGLFPKEIRKKGKEPICSKIFTVALFVRAKNWKAR